MERFAYRFEDEELSQALQGWPSGVAAALCMSSSGLTRIALYDMRSDSDALKRIEAVSGWLPGSYAVSPKLPGVRTMRVTFSEAQEFLRMVEGVDGLTDLARDFLRRKAVRNAVAGAPVDAAPQPKRAPDPVPQEAAFVRHREVPSSRAPAQPFKTAKSALPRPVPWASGISVDSREGDMPSGFRAANEFADGPIAVLPAEIRTTGARVRVVIQPDAVGSRDLPVRAQVVGHRDDMRCFVFGPRCLQNWEPGRGMIVDASMDAFPRGLVARFREEGCRAEVSITPEGIFVTPSAPQEPRLVAPVRAAKARARGPSFAVKLGVLTFVAAGVISGGVTALQTAVSPERGALFYEPAEGNSAFNVVRSIADGMVKSAMD